MGIFSEDIPAANAEVPTYDYVSYYDALNNPDPFNTAGVPSSADVSNTNSGGGVWNGFNKSINNIFTSDVSKQITKMVISDVTKPSGPPVQYVGAVNPPPGDWRTNIFTKMAQPNVQFAMPAPQADKSGGISTTVILAIAAAIGVLFFAVLR